MVEQLSHDGVLNQTEDGYELRFERQLRHSVDKVWTALTEPNQIRCWLATAEILELQAGGAIELRWQNTDLEGNHAVARGHVTQINPPTTLEYDTDIHGLIRWELEPRDQGCLLRLTVTHDLQAAFVVLVLAGWHVHIDFLEDALEGVMVDWPNWPFDRWEIHHTRYAEREDIAELSNAIDNRRTSG